MSNPHRRKIQRLLEKPIDSDFVRNSRTFCMMPWVHLNVGHGGEVVPCCQVSPSRENSLGNIDETPFQEIWNGEKMRAFRRTLLADEPDSRCGECYQGEAVGASSLRKVVNQLYQEKIGWAESTDPDGHSCHAKPIFWDIRFSNFCNFKCRICGFESSSRWHDDAVALGRIEPRKDPIVRSIGDFRNLLDRLDEFLPDLEEIYFAGGEPLIMEEHYEILRRLEARGKHDLVLRYNTNFSTLEYKGRSVLESWKNFDYVMVNASLDGLGARGELQRSGQVWSRVEANRRAMLEACPQADFLLAPTLSVFNAFHLPDFHRSWVERGLVEPEKCVPTLLRTPVEYSMTVLPGALKKKVEATIEQHVAWLETCASEDLFLRDRVVREYRSAVQYMYSADDSHLLDQFRSQCAALDRLRGESVRETFPELRGIWDDR